MILTASGESPVALVTGGSRGIGRAIATGLAHAGCRVAVNYVSSASAAASVVDEIAAGGGRAVAVECDVSDPTRIPALIDTVAEQLGPVDVLVNNAGVAMGADAFESDRAYFDHLMATNARSAYLLTQGVIDGMKERRWGRLIYVSSLAARVGGQISAPYAASKATMEGMMHYYAAQLRAYDITANAVAPAVIHTDLFDNIEMPPAASLPFGRLGQPAEVASIVTALAGNGFVTGQTVQVNGGLVHS